MKNCNLYNRIKAYSPKMRMHMPGHKGKIGKINCKMDITELSFSDNLLYPSGELLNLNRKLADFYGAKYASVLTCGATSGIHIMISKMQGKTLVVDRLCHISVLNAMRIFSVTPIFVNCSYKQPRSVLDIQEVMDMLEVADGALLTYPNYYGDVFDIKQLYEHMKKIGKVLLIDSSHGSHFAYSEKLPVSASIYSDICVFSLHKTTLALTQAALITSNMCNLQTNIAMIHSTSPSYLICCSIDISHRNMLKYYESFINDIQSVIPHSINHDMTRLVIDVSLQGMSGFAVSKLLEKRGIYIEMCDNKHIVCILTPMDKKREIQYLLKLVGSMRGDMQSSDFDSACLHLGTGHNFLKKCDIVLRDLQICDGAVCMQNVVIYPPGIALLTYGDIITKDVLQIIKNAPSNIVGIFDSKVEVEYSER